MKLVDKRRTRRKRNLKSASIPPFIDFDTRTVNANIGVARNVFSLLGNSYSAESFKKVNEHLKDNNRALLSEDDVKELIKYKRSTKLEQLTSAFISSILEGGVYEGELTELTSRQTGYINVRQIQTGNRG